MKLVLLIVTTLAGISQIARAENELIFAKIPNGKAIPIEFEPSDRLERLKEKIKEKEGVPQEQQLLIFNNQLLDDGRQLSKCGLVAGSTVTLLINQRYNGTQKIFVENPLDGKILSVLFLPNMTVADIKSQTLGRRPFEHNKAVCEHKHLFYGDKMLQDDQRLLSDYNVGAWSFLTAVNRYGSRLSRILVRMPSMKTIAVNVATNDTVGSIKDKISAMIGISRDQQRLIFGDKQRENDSDPLDDFDVDSWPLVTLELLPGSGLKQPVFVRTLGNSSKIFSLEVDLNDRISSLKSAIADKTRVPPHLQQLVFGGKLLLDDEKRMSNHDITAWSILTLIVRPIENPTERIIVKLLTNQTINIDVDLRDTVAILKDKIRQKAGVPQYLQRLVFDSRQLENDEQLLDYGIKDGSTVFMVLYLEGAEPWE